MLTLVSNGKDWEIWVYGERIHGIYKRSCPCEEVSCKDGRNK